MQSINFKKSMTFLLPYTFEALMFTTKRYDQTFNNDLYVCTYETI